MKFDVFLSYSSDDHVAVEVLAHRLRADGLRVFLDRWYLVPGANWVRALEERLAGCGAVAVCLGREMGRWQERERAHALDRQAEAERLGQHFPVIPVLLPSLGVKGDVPPGFLRQLTWVDLRATVEDERGLAVLKRAIRGEPPGPDPLADGGNEETRRLRATLCPFRGLLYFREEDEAFFFGRTVSADRLLALVGEQSLVAVVGSSGVGKSSLVRAGLVPRLRRDRATVWEVVTLRPGDRPLRALAQALLPLLEPGMSEVTRLGEVERLAEQFAEGRTALRDVVGRVLEKQPGTDRLMLIVDQWEELVTQTDNADHRRRFIDALLEATQKSALSVVLTLRGDFFGRAIAEHRPLADRLQGGAVMPLGPMTVEELRESIERPADVAGLRIESGLVERMLTDAQDEPGHLPLLEFALRELWDRRQGDLLHVQAYEAVGGLAGAIADKAEGLIGKLGPAEQTEVQRLFLRLVRPGQGEKDARRRAAASEFSDAALPLIRRLSDERLLVTAGGPVAAIETVEVAHEALLHRWQRLRGWIDKDRQFMLWQQEVNAAATKWHDGGRQSDFLLRGVPLAQARVWMKQRPEELATVERAFVQAGVTRRVRVAGAGVASAVAVLVVIGYFYLQAIDERSRADQARERAEVLVNFMVFDLREKLEPIGRLELMESVNDKITAYYEQMGDVRDSAAIERRRNAGLSNLGDQFEAQGNLGKAREIYEKALTISEKLAKADPANSEWQRDLSVSYARLGSVEQKTGRLVEAKRAFEQALAIAERLAKVNPANSIWQWDLSLSYVRLGDVERPAGRLAEAKRAYEQALVIAERLAKADPAYSKWQRDLSMHYQRIGDVEMSAGRLAEARQAYEHALAIDERLVKKDPANSGWQRDLSMSYLKLGDVENDAGQLAEAKRGYEQALVIAKRLAKADPANSEWQRDLSVSYIRLGGIEEKAGRLAEAKRAFEQTLAICERLAKSDPENSEWQRDLSVSYIRLGGVERKAGRFTEAKRAFEQALAIAERLAKADPANSEWQRDLSVSYDALAQVHEGLSDRPSALRFAEASLAIDERLAKLDPQNATWQNDVKVSRALVARLKR